jgi:NAD(P)-dependent dehydrogenase (short-subunit alcohol dehydrogenase family)
MKFLRKSKVIALKSFLRLNKYSPEREAKNMTLSAFSLKGKVAIVTGAGKGIGRAIAIGFAVAGASVVVASRTKADIDNTAAEIKKSGGKALAVITDVTKVSQIKNLLNKTLEAFKRVDILVNNAGGDSGGTGYVLDLSIDDWKSGIELNLNSLFYCCKIIGAEMVVNKSGNIINMTSGMGFGPYPGAAHHAAARAGVINLTKTLALEWAPFNIRVNAIAPGYTETALPAKAWKEHPEDKEALLKLIPLGRTAQPEEMVNTAIFLASSASEYITGETINVNGGLITTVSPRWMEYCREIRGK